MIYCSSVNSIIRNELNSQIVCWITRITYAEFLLFGRKPRIVEYFSKRNWVTKNRFDFTIPSNNCSRIVDLLRIVYTNVIDYSGSIWIGNTLVPENSGVEQHCTRNKKQEFYSHRVPGFLLPLPFLIRYCSMAEKENAKRYCWSPLQQTYSTYSLRREIW